MNGDVWQVEEERFIFARGDELHRLFGEVLRQSILRRRCLDDLLFPQKRRWRHGVFGIWLFSGAVHVIRVGNSEEVIEPMPRWEELRLVA